MINKVNRPDYLQMVSQPKPSENDPGSSQGNGNVYEAQQKKDSSRSPGEEDSAEKAAREEAKQSFMLVTNIEQVGMTEVVKDFLENKKTEVHASPGLSTKYASDSQPAKGLLLNKKAE